MHSASCCSCSDDVTKPALSQSVSLTSAPLEHLQTLSLFATVNNGDVIAGQLMCLNSPGMLVIVLEMCHE